MAADIHCTMEQNSLPKGCLLSLAVLPGAPCRHLSLKAEPILWQGLLHSGCNHIPDARPCLLRYLQQDIIMHLMDQSKQTQ